MNYLNEEDLIPEVIIVKGKEYKVKELFAKVTPSLSITKHKNAAPKVKYKNTTSYEDFYRNATSTAKDLRVLYPEKNTGQLRRMIDWARYKMRVDTEFQAWIRQNIA